MLHKPDEFLWVQKYRPQIIEDVILPQDIKKTLKKFVEKGNLPHFIFSGNAGVGKTTIALALVKELGADSIILNGSLSANIDTLRTQIRDFASSVSLAGGRKYVILDEADGLSPNHVQPALRNFMEEYSNNCGFILTCNFKNKIIKPLRSRCTTVDFQIEKAEKPKLAGQFFKRVTEILDAEGIDYDKKVVAQVVQQNFPDFRKTLNEIQQYSVDGKIDSGILTRMGDKTFDELVLYLRKRDFPGIRKWVALNSDNDSTLIFRKVFDYAENFIAQESVPNAILVIAKYQYQEAFSVDPEINLIAFFVELMYECQVKE